MNKTRFTIQKEKQMKNKFSETTKNFTKQE